MEIIKEDLLKARQLLISRLNGISEGYILSLPKKTLSLLLFDYSHIAMDGKNQSFKTVVLDDSLLSKLDLTGIDMDPIGPLNKSPLCINDVVVELSKSRPELASEESFINGEFASSIYDTFIVELGGVINNTHPIKKEDMPRKLEK